MSTASVTLTAGPAPQVQPVPPPARDAKELAAALRRLRRRGSIRIGDALLELGLISREQLRQVEEARRDDASLPIGAMMVSLGLVQEESVRAALALQLGVPAVDLRHWTMEPGAASQLPAPVVRRYGAVPVHRDGATLYVALSDVLDSTALDALRVVTPLTVQQVYAPAADIAWVLDRSYLTDAAAMVSDEDLERHTDQYSDAEPVAREVAFTDNVIVRLADQIIAEAYGERASDIHIEPLPEHGKTAVRVRIDGRMFVRRSIPAVYRDALVSRIKVMANLDVAQHRVPQDGKISFRKGGGAPVELRVAILPTVGGVEDVVMRILDTSSALPLSALGLAERDHARLTDAIGRPYGILLVCGPTGSGKTTTLHAALRQLNDGSRKILTVENPVEITQPGLRQVEVNPRAGLTFASALRAFLRADPDVIMVGEVRDAETAKTALEASLTGHLVLSTLHTNNAPESVVRLLEMGMNPFNFADALLGILAQRLVRSLCRQCREPVEASDEMLASLAREHQSCVAGGEGDHRELIDGWRRRYGQDGRITLHRAKGCAECGDTGYRGRVGLFELMPATDAVKRLIISGGSAAELFELALGEGMQTLRQDGIHKVLDGTTELSQVLAASQR